MDVITWIALGVFLVVYVALTAELAHKTIVTLLGACLYIFLGVVGTEEAFHFVDWNVVFLLLGMMIITSIAKHSGLFQYLAIKAAKIARGDPVRILVLLSLITAFISALLDNVTTVLIIAPVVILIAVELGLSPVPFLIAAAVASNIGGTMTLIGDPPNIMIGSAAGLSFGDFIVNLAPPVLVSLAAFGLMAALTFRRKLMVSATQKARIMSFDEKQAIVDRPRLVKSLVVLGLVVLGFLFHGPLGVEASAIALGGATLLMLLTNRHEVDEVFKEIEWGTIFFFVGLFVLVGGLVKLGVIAIVAKFLLNATGGHIPTTSYVVIWASGVLSAFVDNIPYVATMIPLIQDVGNSLGTEAIRPLWWALSLGACLGGNGTLIGASANVVAAGIAKKSGHPVTFLEFTKYGAVMTLVTLAIATVYVWLRYFLLA